MSFIASGILARFYETEAGDSSGFAVAGNEGAVDLASFLGGMTMPTQAMVIETGHAYRIKADVISSEIMRVSSLSTALLLYIQATVTQLTLDIVCNRYHAIEQQLCR